MKSHRANRKKQILYQIVAVAAAAVFLGCAVLLIDTLVVQPRSSDKMQDTLKSIYYSSAADRNSHPESGSQAAPANFSELRKINPDIAGWITIPNTVIDLPVLQASAKDPDFYLTHDYRKNHSVYGSIYADCNSPVLDPNSKSILLYGHSLLSGRMFTQLKNYKSLDFYKTTPVFTFNTANGKNQWKVISVLITNTKPDQGKLFQYMRTKFKSDSDYLNFVYQLRIRSIYNTGVSFNARDKILLLSTCSYEFSDFREVVVARRVRSGESNSVDTGRAAYSSRTLYPDCWYQKHGGTKPAWPGTYEQAVREKLLSWDEN